MEVKIGSSLFLFNKENPWQISDQCEASAVPYSRSVPKNPPNFKL
jgi:hypothetical protein